MNSKIVYRCIIGALVVFIGALLIIILKYPEQPQTEVSRIERVQGTAAEQPQSEMAQGTVGVEEAEKVLVTYFDLLSTQRYADALAHHGSGFEQLHDWNPNIAVDDAVTLLKHGCEMNGWNCIKIKKIVFSAQTDSDTYKFFVQFSNNDGSLFEQGQCCGGNDEDYQTQSEFEYEVAKVDGTFQVMTSPTYTP